MKTLLTLFIVCFFFFLNFAQQVCVSLSGYDVNYLNTVTSDNVNYPPGTAFITSGDIQYVKPGINNYYQGIQGDSLFYVGDIDIDISLSSCTAKVLTFSCMYLEGLAVDGDTIFSALNPPATYSGANFTFEYLGNGDYQVTGDFDVVSLYSSTNYLYDVCLACSTPSGSECVSLSGYDVNYLNTVTSDDVNYPPGTAFITSGDIQYVKPSINNYYQGIQGDSLFYVGDIDIDVSLSSCTNKVLTFSCIYLEGLAVDGDTIFSALNPPATYSGANFTFEYLGNGDYQVTGDFDVVSLYSSTNFLYDVCLACDGLAGDNELIIEQTEVYVYPNPSKGVVTISSNQDQFTYAVYTSMGSQLESGNVYTSQTAINLSENPAGIYLLSIEMQNGERLVKKIYVAD